MIRSKRLCRGRRASARRSSPAAPTRRRRQPDYDALVAAMIAGVVPRRRASPRSTAWSRTRRSARCSQPRGRHAARRDVAKRDRGREPGDRASGQPTASYLGDWREGEKLAQSGRGMTWTDTTASAGQRRQLLQLPPDRARRRSRSARSARACTNYGKHARRRAIRRARRRSRSSSTPGASSGTPRPTTPAPTCRASATPGILDEQQIQRPDGAAARSRSRRSTSSVQRSRVELSTRKARIPAGAGRRSARPAWRLAPLAPTPMRPPRRAACTTLPTFGNVSLPAHDRLPRAAASRSTSASRASTSASARCSGTAAAPGRRAPAEGGGRAAPGTRRRACVHLPRLRRRRRARYGKVGGFAHLATLVKRLKASRARRAAARRRRHLAGLGDRAVDEGPGHGRRRQAARRRRHDRPLGVHLRHGARQGDRREGLRGHASTSSRRT